MDYEEKIIANRCRGTAIVENAIILAFVCALGFSFLSTGSFGSSVHSVVRTAANMLGMEIPNTSFKAGVFDVVINSLRTAIAQGNYGAVKGARLDTNGDCNSQTLFGPDAIG